MSGDVRLAAKDNEEAEEGRGSRRKNESRRRLLDAARRLFVKKGYHDTRPQDVSRDAGVGHGTFYLHFQDKKDCFLAFVDEACAELDDAVEAHLKQASDLEGQIRGILKAIFEYADANPGVLGAAMTDPGLIAAGDTGHKTLMERWGDQWAEKIMRYMRKGQVRDDYDPEIIGHAIIGLIHQASMYAYRHGYQRDKLVHNLTTFLVRALVTREA
jgi:AcrR family transcriptional regulator